MRVISFKKILAVSVFVLLFLNISSAQETFPFSGEINADNINIRSDSTVSSEIICAVSRGEQAEVVLELYEWYKIRLPKTAPAYIKKSLVECVNYKITGPQETNISPQTNKECQALKVLKDRVNIRLHPNESSPVLGVAIKSEVVRIVKDEGGWYQIEPINDSFGWVNKRFVERASPPQPQPQKTEETGNTDNKARGIPSESEKSVNLEGIIKPYGRILWRVATHKLITRDNNIFLIKGSRESLNALNYHKVRLAGKIID